MNSWQECQDDLDEAVKELAECRARLQASQGNLRELAQELDMRNTNREN